MSGTHNPVGWFEIPVTDLDRAKTFYETVFGFFMEEHVFGNARTAWFPMAPDVGGAAGSLVQADGCIPSRDGVLVYFTAPDMVSMLQRVSAAGGTVITGRSAIGEYGFIALVMDTEGNRIGLHSRV
ncbi:MAG TPA: VOC family protein [bacterium]|nr:VOC family protein [bacterium]